MLESVDLKEKHIEKHEYKALRKELSQRLIMLQQEAIKCGAGMVVLFEGWDAAGKGSRISDLLYFLDARATKVHVPHDVNFSEQKEISKLKSGVSGMHPFMKEYWEELGERGNITFFDQGWYTKATQLSLLKKKGLSSKELDSYIASIKDFERQLTKDGYCLVKFFLHISQNTQSKRLRDLEIDPATAWRVDKKKLNITKYYNQAYRSYDKLLESSNFDFAPWTLVAAEDERATNLKVIQTLVDSLESMIERKQSEEHSESLVVVKEDATPLEIAKAQSAFSPPSTKFKLSDNELKVENIKHDLKLDQKEYKNKLKKLQKEIFELENIMFQNRIPMIVMYEGWDAAGKGGAIKRLAQSLDARSYSIIPSPAPTKEELAHPHLWRYWTRLPKAGHVGIFDRSWYGRVLVERVEEITRPEAWARGYDEINEFERDLIDWGAILIKFWVNVSQEEQLNRFKAREQDPKKQWKITEEDWRNRNKYEQYKAAIDDMFRLTSTDLAPWTILESDDKLYARIKSLEIIKSHLLKRLDGCARKK